MNTEHPPPNLEGGSETWRHQWQALFALWRQTWV